MIYLFFEFLWKKSNDSLRWSWLLVQVSILSFITVNAQDFAIHQYRVEDGLPSSFIYDIAQDKEGFIWISAEGGLCRFDGSRFEKNPIPEGLTSEVIELNVDSRGQLWMIDLATNIGYFDGETVHWKEEFGASRNFQFVNFEEDLNGNYWFLNAGFIVTEIHKEGGESYQIKYERRDLRQSNLMVEGPENLFYVFSNFGVGVFEDYKLTYRPFKQPFKDLPGNGFFYEGKILFSVVNELFLYDPQLDTITTAFPEYQPYHQSEIVKLLYHKGNLWIASKDGVLLIQDLASDAPRMTKLLDGVVAGNILVDQHGGYWISSHGNGLFHLPSLDTEVIPTENTGGILTAVGADEEGNLALGFNNSLLQIRDTGFQVLHEEYLSPLKNRTYEIFYDRGGDNFLVTSRDVFLIDSMYQVKTVHGANYLKAGRISEDGQIWLGASSFSCFILEGDTLAQRSQMKRTYAVEPLGDGKAWLGTIGGLYYYDGKEAVAIDQPEFKQDIHDIQLAADSTLWISTPNDGVLLYREDSLQYHFTTDNGLLSNHCRKILLDERFAWVATNQGVNQIYLDDYSKIYSIGKDEGLPSTEVNDLTKSRDKMVIATSKGLAVFEDTIQFEQLPVRLHLSQIKIQEKDTTIDEKYDLNHEQNNIKIEFSGLTFRHPENIRYEYQMVGIDEDWVSTHLGVAQYPSLPSGKYTFRLRATTINTIWSEEKVIHFNISKAYWEEWWFYLGLVLMSGALGAVFIQAIIEDYQKRNIIKEKLKNSQLIALRARMNPHFLFNALNSIQELIVRNDKRLANRYLAQFSRLMRNILNMSDQDEVSLQTEIESIELYLSLEALRFEKDFEFHFDIAEEINTQQIKIPSMLIQPYVENAIIHGLMHRRGLKKLLIGFRWENSYLVVVVEDNGVGRKRAKEIRKNNGRPHPSTGMGLTKNRLDLLNSTQQDHLSVRIEDLEDEYQQAVGTRVTIYITLKNSMKQSIEQKKENLTENI